MPPRVPEPDVPLFDAARIRVIYGDTDRMGVVYHGTYLRYLEHARVEFMRDRGAVYVEMERAGMGLPVTDLAVTYLAPARYDDVVTVEVGVTKLGYARIHFAYRLVVRPEDRYTAAGDSPLSASLVVLHAETRHACIDLEDGRPTRMPERLHDVLSEHLRANPPGENR